MAGGRPVYTGGGVEVLVKRGPDRTARRRRFGGSSTEYMLVLALVVIPIALLSPMLVRMVAIYGNRIVAVIRSPFS